METNSLILALVGFVQIIVLGLGAWMLATLVKLNATIAALNVTLTHLEASSTDYYAFRRAIEPKMKLLWAEYEERRQRERGSGGDLPTFPREP